MLNIPLRSNGRPEGQLLAITLDPPVPHQWIRRALRLGLCGWCPDADAVQILSPDVPSAAEQPLASSTP